MKKIAVIVFPGSNCDHDLVHVFQNLLKKKVEPIWHESTSLKDSEAVIIPGGFSYGDYLRTGALAKLSPIMSAIKEFAESGRPVLGICNGFQILCEAGLLPGALLPNSNLRFLSQFVSLKVEQNNTLFTSAFKASEIINCPIAHGEGNYFVDAETLKKIEDNQQVVLRYCSPGGTVAHKNLFYNPNGSINSIAGICNEQRNVLGIMPHPERVCETLVGHYGANSGLNMFKSLVA